MNLLGIHDGHDASAALLQDGRLVGAVQEERHSRLKNQDGYPARSIAAVLEHAGIAPGDIDAVACAGRISSTGLVAPGSFDRGRLVELHRAMVQGETPAVRIKNQLGRSATLRARRRRGQQRRRADAFAALFPGVPVTLVDHHTSHASGAYFGWGKLDGEVLVLTADGEGDDLSGSVSLGRDGALRRIAAIPRSESLGWIYEAITYLLGMQPGEHEYKVMGLAPFAEGAPRVDAIADRLLALIDLDDDERSTELVWHRRPGVGALNRPTGVVAPLIERERFDHVAAAAQRFIETSILRWVRRCVRATGIRRVALSGGVFMNVKVNGLLLALPDIDELFVTPTCTDASNSIGAAFAVHAGKGGAPPEPLADLYLGDDIAGDDVDRAVAALGSGYEVTRPGDPDERVAELIAAGEVVGRATGRMEFGARALGNRSLLADPSRPEVVRTLNALVKSRDFWMPFAPAAPEEDVDRYVEGGGGARHALRYMMVALPATTAGAQHFPAAQHPFDGTTRIQAVPESWNPSFHRVLRRFESRRGQSIVLNTSLNVHGEPIARTAADAVSVLTRSGLRHLQVGSVLISKVD